MNNKPLQSSETINCTGLTPAIFCSMIFVISVSYGYRYRIPETLVPYYFVGASGIFISLVLALMVLILRSKPTLSSLKNLEAVSLPHLATALTWATVLSGFYFYGGPAYLPAATMMVLTTLVTATLVILRRCKEALWALAIIGISLFVYLSLATPLDVTAANMLPIIGAGCDSLLHGENPFLRVYPEIATAPLYYLPLAVLPYCPLQSLGLDLRWLNVAVFLALMILLIKTFNFLKSPETLGLTFLPLLISPMLLQASHYGHVWIYWIGLVIMADLLWRGRLWLVAVLIGLLLLTRQTYVFIAGLLGASLLGTLGWKTCLKYGTATVTIAIGGFLMTYLLTNVHPLEFYSAVKTASEATHKGTSNPMDQISLSGLFVILDMRPILMEMQLLIASILGLVFLRFLGSRTVSIVIMLIGLGYMVIISLSVFIHRYFYIPGFLLIAYGLAIQLQEQLQPVCTQPQPPQAVLLSDEQR